MWAVVPVKRVTAAKQRLASVLTPSERRRLFRAMLSDVLSALVAVEDSEGLAIVSSDPEAAEFAERFGARLIVEVVDRGQTAAVTTAAAVLAAEGVERMMTLPGDVPLVTPGEIRRVRAALDTAPCMAIVPARDEQGSNCIACSPPDGVPFQFGEGSFRRHLDRARLRGIEPKVLPLPGLGLDIDTPADLAALLPRDSDTKTHSFLISSGITDRLMKGGRLEMGQDR